MKKMIAAMIMIAVILAMPNVAFATTPRATHSITTDSSIYVSQQAVHLHIIGYNNSSYNYYRIVWYNDTYSTYNSTGAFLTNDTGIYDVVIHIYLPQGEGINALRYTIEVQYSNSTAFPWWNTVTDVSTNVTVRRGMLFEESKYTGVPNEYVPTDDLWINVYGENNAEYQIDITDSSNMQYAGPVSVQTDNKGYGVTHLVIPGSIDDGVYYVNLYLNGTLVQRKTITITSIVINAVMDKTVYLRAENFAVYYSVSWIKTGENINDATIKWEILYSNYTRAAGPYWSDKSPIISRTLRDYDLPFGAYILKMECNYTYNNSLHHAEKYITFYIGTFSSRIYINTLDGETAPGDRISITVYSYASYNWYTSPVKNATINYISIKNVVHWNETELDNYTNLHTNLDGIRQLIWTIPTVEIGSEIKITVNISYNGEYTEYVRTFTVTSGSVLTIETDKDEYLAGDVMHITANVKHPDNVQITSYQFIIYSPGRRVLYYTVTSNPTVSYAIPNDIQGKIKIYASAHLSSGEVIYDIDYVPVYYGYIYITPSDWTYKQSGETISIYTTLTSNVMTHPTYTYTVFDDNGNIVMKTVSSMQTFNFTIPANPSDSYVIRVEAIQDEYYVSNSIQIMQFMGYDVQATVITKSKFQNMIYEPGQTIQIKYNITKYGDFDSHVVILHWAIFGTDYKWYRIINTNEFTGTINLTIPSDLKGNILIQIWVEDGNGVASTVSIIPIDVESGSWSMQDIAGMPMAAFLNLVLVIIALIIAIVALIMIFRGRSGTSGGTVIAPPKRKKTAPKPFEPQETETAPQPQTPPPAEEEPLMDENELEP